MDDSAQFINKDIVKITGLNPKTIDFYTKTGVVLPSIFAGMGKGTARIYSKDDVRKFMLLKELQAATLSLDMIKEILSECPLYEDFEFPLSESITLKYKSTEESDVKKR